MDQTRELLIGELTISADRLIKTAASSKWNGTGWGPVVTFGHMSDVDEQVWLARLELMVQAFREGKSPPTFTSWEPDAEVTQSTYEDFSLEEAIQILRSQRFKIISYLNGLSPEEWNATAEHSTFGIMNVEKCLQRLLIHDEEHRANLD